jgi:sortase A
MDKYYYYKESKSVFKKVIGIGCVLIGITLIIYLFFPLLYFRFYYPTMLEKSSITVPIPAYLLKANSLYNPLTGNLITTEYMDVRNWYPHLEGSTGSGNLINSYLLTIPKLKIEKAEVSAVDFDLSKHLVHYYSTILPGEKGTAVIFGHSSLPHLFRPKDYTTIFSNLHTLRNGDMVYVQVNGVRYPYRIFSMVVTESDDSTIFSQSHDDSYITLVTCFPPGTVMKRLVVRAKIAD